LSLPERKALIDRDHDQLSIARQCSLLSVSRATAYYQPVPVSTETLNIARAIDEIHTALPFLGSRRMVDELEDREMRVNRKCVQRLMRIMGITAIYEKPKTSLPGKGAGHQVYPYLLAGVEIDHPNLVWATDITFIPMAAGFAYLVAIMDVHSRRILSWRLSNTPDARFCIDALQEALERYGPPEIFNSDQGSQFTSTAFTRVLEEAGIRISMDGKGRWIDNVFIERFWRSLKYEEVYLHAYDDVREARRGIERYMAYYNLQRRHASLDRQTPEQAYNPSVTSRPFQPAVHASGTLATAVGS